MLPFLLPYQHALASRRLARRATFKWSWSVALSLFYLDLKRFVQDWLWLCVCMLMVTVWSSLQNQCLWTDNKSVPNLSRVKMEQRQNTNVWLKFNNESGLPARIWTHCCNLMTCGHRRHKLHEQDCGPCHDSHPESGSPQWGDAHRVLQKTGLDIISSWQ